MKNLIYEMADLFSRGQSFVLATVVSRNGSAPRSAGARMVLRNDHSTLGTVGGGILEAQVEQLAAQVISTHEGILQGFKFSGKDAATMDAICGGEVEVLVEWMDVDNPELAQIIKGLQEAFVNRQKVWLLTRLAGGGRLGMLTLVQGDGYTIGRLPPGFQVEEAGVAGAANRLPLQDHLDHVMAGQDRLMVEPLDSGKTAFIFGAGHVSRALAEFTHTVGFRTVVLDDRAEYANNERFPVADQLIVLDSFAVALERVSINHDSFIVIVTRGHLNDREVLAQSLRTDAGYIGMIGSRRKCALIFDQLRKEGFNEADIQRVHAPIGLAIEAETPEEIGVSIVAEMIQVRAKLDEQK